MKIIPPRIDATLKSIKRTLQEKPALIPLTPDAPATFEGSLQPGHAIREDAKFIHKRPSNVTNRSISGTSIISPSHASGFLVRKNHAFCEAASLLRTRELLNSRFASV